MNLFDIDSLRIEDEEDERSETAKAAEGFAGWAYVFNLERHKRLGIKEESEVSEDA